MSQQQHPDVPLVAVAAANAAAAVAVHGGDAVNGNGNEAVPLPVELPRVLVEGNAIPILPQSPLSSNADDSSTDRQYALTVG